MASIKPVDIMDIDNLIKIAKQNSWHFYENGILNTDKKKKLS